MNNSATGFPESLNAACSTIDSIGKNKAEVVGSYIRKINPEITIEIFDQGVNENNVGDFVSGSNLLIDETDFTRPDIGAMLARTARSENIPNLLAMNLGFGATVTSFSPSSRTFESIMGLSEGQPLDEIREKGVELKRWLSYIPPYGDISVLKKVQNEGKPAPTLVAGVAMAAAIANTQSFLHIVSDVKNHRPKPVYAPKTIMIDAMTGKSDIIKSSQYSYYKHLFKLIARNIISINPKASY